MNSPATRSALVTGGTSGIGAAVVKRLSNDGFRVAFTGRNAARGAAVAADTGAMFIPADLTDPGSGEATAAVTAEGFGGIDVLVHNAGIDHEGALSDTDDATWDTLAEVNLFAALRQVNGSLPYLCQSAGGSVVLMASDAALWPESAVAAYSVAKRALAMLGRMLAVDCATAGVRVNVLCPGDTAPGMRSTATGYSETGDVQEWFTPPLGRVGQAHDVAGAVAFLTSADAAFCTGATLLVDGGMRASTYPVDRLTVSS